MLQIQRILCPIDFSEFSRHALDHALAIARWYGGAITALHVIPPMPSLQPAMGPGLYPPIVFTPDDLDQCRAELEKFVREESGSIPVRALVMEGGPVGEVVRVANELPADILVMGTHGRSGFERVMLGSVAERLLRKAPCPVLTVPQRAVDAVPTGPVLYRRILCAIDFSPSSHKALEYAASLADAAGAQLTLMHVVELVPMVEPVFVGAPGYPQYEESLRDHAREVLADLATRHRRAGRTIQEILGEGKPYREILRVAQEERSDLVVIGVHGGAAGLFAFGSTANHVVRATTCPVLSLRA